MTAALVVLGGYLLGSMPFGYWVVLLLKGEDVRTVGSGNIGATNVWRTYGKAYGIPIVLLDVAKGFVPALVGDAPRRRARRRARGRGGDARPLAAALPPLPEGRQDRRDGGRGVLRRRAAARR